MRPYPFLFVFTLLGSAAADAEQVTIAVASNFNRTAVELAREFEVLTGHSARLVSGSSGKLYAQIVNGAPYDVFLSADAERPARLDAEQRTVPGTRRAYAFGRLVLFSRDPDIGPDCLDALAKSGSARLAIANPEHAPYGLAARQYLVHSGLWERFRTRLVIGENVMQAFLFAAEGGASFSLTAAAVVEGQDTVEATCNVPVPPATYAPIEQQAVQLARASGSRAAAAFLEYLGSEPARERILRAGYRLPGSE